MDLLYQHTRTPTHWGVAVGCPSVAVSNPGCGDRQRLSLNVAGDGSGTVLFQATGCSLSRAATSLLLEQAEGLSRDEVLQLDGEFLADLISPEVVLSRPRCILLGLGGLKELSRATSYSRLSA